MFGLTDELCKASLTPDRRRTHSTASAGTRETALDIGFLTTGLLTGLREGVEAALIVSIILAYLAKTGNRRHFGSIWFGTGAAFAVSVVVGVVLFVTIGCFEENVGSKRVIERVGFRYLCRFEDDVWRDGRWHAHLRFELTASEWADSTRTLRFSRPRA